MSEPFTEPLSFGLVHRSLNLLNRLGIEFSPYLLYRERHQEDVRSPCDDYAVETLTDSNLESTIERFPDRVFLPQQWRTRVAEGDIGLLVTQGEELVGYTWANLRFVAFRKRLFKLSENQAYITNTYITKGHRQRGLARYLHETLSVRLGRLGRSDIFSTSEYFNVPARRLKTSLGVDPSELRVSMRLFGGRRMDVRLRKYAPTGNGSTAPHH